MSSRESAIAPHDRAPQIWFRNSIQPAETAYFSGKTEIVHSCRELPPVARSRAIASHALRDAAMTPWGELSEILNRTTVQRLQG
jgi:hypothetical protein